MTADGLAGRAAIAGIGQTEFSKESGRTELQLACEAVQAALADAGLRADDVDGLVTFTMDTTEEMELAAQPRDRASSRCSAASRTAAAHRAAR